METTIQQVEIINQIDYTDMIQSISDQVIILKNNLDTLYKLTLMIFIILTFILFINVVKWGFRRWIQY